MASEFCVRRRVQFAETDMAGVMHFANYFRVMEEVEHAFWRSHGLSVQSSDGQRNYGWPRVQVSCEYFAPARFEEELEVRLRVVQVGSRSVEFEFEFTRDRQRLARGRMTAVCCAVGPNGTFEAVEIPREIRKKLTAAAPDA